MDLCWQSMSLLFIMLSSLFITFLPRSKCLLISWLQSPSAVILGPPKIKSDTVSTVSPSISQEVIATDWFQIGKRVCQGCMLSPCLFNLHAEYIMRNAGRKKHKLESRLPGEISITSDMQMTPPLWQKVKRNSKAS